MGCFCQGQLSKRDEARIKKEFGNYLDIHVTPSGGMTGSVHAHFFLGEVLPKACEQIRAYWGVDGIALLQEDWSPTHVGDKCRRTGEDA